MIIGFPDPDPEQWYDATWSVRVLPRHIWDSIPRGRAEDTATRRLVGSGPFRLAGWVKGQSLTLVRREETGGPGERIRRVVWRFADEPDAALNLLLSHVRRALALALDRGAAARAVFGPEAMVPAGPMSRALWVNDPAIPVVPRFEPSRAGRELDAAGWTRSPAGGSTGVRQRGGRRLAVDILVPGTSVTRRNLAQIVQEMWRQAGVQATVTTVDFSVFQERLRTGRFESFIGAWLDEPSPRSLAAQWTTAGIGSLNYVRYRNPLFDSLYHRAARFQGPSSQARAAWWEALDALNADVPAIWLYTPTLVAAATRRLEGFGRGGVDPYSWLSGLPDWTLRDQR